MELETGEEVKKAPHRELINAVRLAVRAHLMLSKFTQNANRKNTLAPNAVADTTVNCKACQQAGKGNTGKGNTGKGQRKKSATNNSAVDDTVKMPPGRRRVTFC